MHRPVRPPWHNEGRMVTAERLRLAALSYAMTTRGHVRNRAWRIGTRWPSKVARTELPLPASLSLPKVDRVEGFEPLPGIEESWAFTLTGGAIIEPKYGWIIAPPFGLVAQSLPYYQWTEVEPSLIQGPPIRAGLPGKKTTQLDAVLSMRTPWETNYFHFFNDIVGRMRMVKELGIPESVPAVVSQRVAATSFFKAAMELDLFGRPIVVQGEDEHIIADTIYVCKKAAGNRADLDYFLDRIPESLMAGPATRRIFLQRSAQRGRTLANGPAAEAIAAAFGFEPVDPDGLSLQEQIGLFAGASHVIGVHSAGLVNIMFARGSKMSVLEILPPGGFPPGWNALDRPRTDFEFLCDSFGFSYESIGSLPPENFFNRTQNFDVDLAEFERAVQRMCEPKS